MSTHPIDALFNGTLVPVSDVWTPHQGGFVYAGSHLARGALFTCTPLREAAIIRYEFNACVNLSKAPRNVYATRKGNSDPTPVDMLFDIVRPLDLNPHPYSSAIFLTPCCFNIRGLVPRAEAERWGSIIRGVDTMLPFLTKCTLERTAS